MVHPVRTFNVTPSLPPGLERLRELAYNLRWSWDSDTLELLRRLDLARWEETGHNPVLMLCSLPQERLVEAAADEGFRTHLDRVWERYQQYMEAAASWYRRRDGNADAHRIAYFSAEFGITECLPIYSGGLGVLSADHLKSASDLGLPLVGVGLLYQQGYFRQYLNDDGWQGELNSDNDFHTLPVTLERWPDGNPVCVAVDLPGRRVTAQVWRVQVGRVPLYLLDTNLGVNRREDQDITDRLYTGDRDMRIRQEIVLGIGGMRALVALGQMPVVCHMNEGHTAFAALERIRWLVQQQRLSFAEAREAASAGLVFTTHTPVPAGNEYFAPELVDQYFGEYYRSLGLSRQEFLALGRQNAGDDSEHFCMTVLALRLAAYSNAVSRLHGDVSRHMWQRVWPDFPENEIPIGHVTNGVHFPSWISQDMANLYDRYLGPRWLEDPADQSVWDGLSRMPAEELWRTHERRREHLVAFTRQRLRTQLARRGAAAGALAQADEVLDPDALTIGFARRFATYKRAKLLFKDPERLARIMNNRERPVQIIYSGKAHPEDTPAKELIRDIVHLARQPEFRNHLVFVEDYDINVARHLVQGVDVWLNTPRRRLEASGTSGMKATANGGLNISVLDGWWDEAYQPGVGLAIGRGEVYEDHDYEDAVESSALYDVLEQEVVPMFYDRQQDGLPRRWIALMKKSMQSICPVFNTNRMVHQYWQRHYLPAAARYDQLAADAFRRARELAVWRQRVRAGWGCVFVKNVEAELPPNLHVGDKLDVKATINLGALASTDVIVQLYMGKVDAEGNIVEAKVVPMVPAQPDGHGVYHFLAHDIECDSGGMLGYTVRVLPAHDDLPSPLHSGLLTWASPA